MDRERRSRYNWLIRKTVNDKLKTRLELSTSMPNDGSCMRPEGALDSLSTRLRKVEAA